MSPEQIGKQLKEGKIGVIPTDTLYGVVASAFSKDAVNRIYDVKGRNPEKPFIILVSTFDDLEKFGAEISDTAKDFLMENWPGPLSAIIPIRAGGFEYLDRGKGSLAFRMPDSEYVQNILRETGPIVAPSANPEGMEPARTIAEARTYFGERIDFYADGGELSGEPSTIVDMRSGKIDMVRQGAFKIAGE